MKKAETLNQLFSEVFTAENQDIPGVDFGFHSECLADIHISEEKIRKKLETLDITKSPGPDGVYLRVMMELSGPLSASLRPSSKNLLILPSYLQIEELETLHPYSRLAMGVTLELTHQLA